MNTQDKLAESLRKLADDWHDALPEITASDCIQELRDEIEAYAGETSQSQVQSAEWVLVPREPTDGMLQAAEDAVNAASNCESTTDDLSAIAYKAALAAAPQSQAAEPFMYTWSEEPDKDGVFRKIPLYTHPQPVQDASKYQELLMAVEKKFPGESRHETALRYIRETELQSCEPKCDAAMAKESSND